MSDAAGNLEPLDGGVVVMRLDRAPVNALNPDFLALIRERLDALERDPGVRALVLTGAGKTLSGGMDLKELQGFSTADQAAMVDGLNTTYARLYAFPRPVIAAAHGAAIAGGLFFVLVSDWRVAGERAVFGLAEVRVGVRFPVGPLAIAVAELTPAACRRLMLGGRNHGADDALAMGIVDEVVPAEQVMERAVAVARDYAAIPPQTFAAVKRQLRGPLLERVAAMVADGSDPMSRDWLTPETHEAVRATLAALARR